MFQEYFLSNNAIVFFFFLGLAFTSIAHPFFFDSANAFVEENPSAAPYVALTGWYKKNNVTEYTHDLGFAERFGVRNKLKKKPSVPPFSLCTSL